jgi:hypothetical protein
MDGAECLTLSDYVNKKKVRQLHRQAIFKAFDHKCAYCGSPAQSLDHVKPRHKGGQNLSSNLVPACLECNQTKGSSDLWDFYHEGQAFYSASRAEFLKQWVSGEILALRALSVEELGKNNVHIFLVGFN